VGKANNPIVRTLGCDEKSDEEKWQNSSLHLAFIKVTHFPNLQRVKLCDRPNYWEKKEELNQFAASMANQKVKVYYEK